MIYINNLDEHNPAANLALEEYALRNIRKGDDLLLFYINEPSIIVGRHQNTLEEINIDFVEQQGIHVVRRLSGGGAVYHDLGNLNFSFITEAKPENFRNFKKFTAPIIKALMVLGITAELNGRNDILVDGRKVSGNAQYISKGRMVSHGTLLFNSDLSQVSEALKVQEGKIISKGIKSVRSRVTNISSYLNQPLDIQAFRNHLLEYIFEGIDEIPEYRLTENDWLEVNHLSNERYKSWDWTYGHSPDFNVERHAKFSGGEIDARIDVQQGVIKSIKFYGDYFAESDPVEIEQILTGVRYNREDILAVLSKVTIDRFFSGMDFKTFITLIS